MSNTQASSSNSTHVRSSPMITSGGRRSKVIDDDADDETIVEQPSTIPLSSDIKNNSANNSSSPTNGGGGNSSNTPSNSSNTIKLKKKPVRPKSTVEFHMLYDLSPEIISQYHSKPISTAKISPNSKLMATASADGTIRIWDLIEKVSNEQENQENSIDSISGTLLEKQKPPGVFNPDNINTTSPSSRKKSGSTTDLFAFAKGNDEMGSKDTTSGGYKFKIPQPITSCIGHTRGVNDVCWSPDSKYICSASDDGSVRLWSTEDGNELMRLLGHNQFAYCVAYSPSGNIIASGSYDETVRLWDVKTGKCLRTLPAHSDPVTSVSFSRDGSLLVTSSYDGFCRIWDTTTGQCLKTILKDPHDAPPLSCSKLSPHGNFLLVSCLAKETEPGIVRLWQVRPTVRNVKNFVGHVNNRFSVNVTFHPKENIILSCSEDGCVYIWDVQTESIISKLNCNTNNFDRSPLPKAGGDTMDTTTDSDQIYPVLSLDINALDLMVTCTTEPRLILWRSKTSPTN